MLSYLQRKAWELMVDTFFSHNHNQLYLNHFFQLIQTVFHSRNEKLFITSTIA